MAFQVELQENDFAVEQIALGDGSLIRLVVNETELYARVDHLVPGPEAGTYKVLTQTTTWWVDDGTPLPFLTTGLGAIKTFYNEVERARSMTSIDP